MKTIRNRRIKELVKSTRTAHKSEVRAFLGEQFSTSEWEFSLPHGWGNESYFARGDGKAYFVKLAAPLATYQAMATLGLTPPVLASGRLEDGTTVLVQPYVQGKTPTWTDYRHHLEQIASMVRVMHHSEEVRRALPETASNLYNELGLAALGRVRQRWNKLKSKVSNVAGWVDESLDRLATQIESFAGSETVASHNDICNANWLITADGQIYIIDLDSMAIDDPANDLGALLWWYYPPALRPRFIDIAGYINDHQLNDRMRVRMAIHCLHILLPRENSYDIFHPENFAQSLADFRAILAGEENPQGYDDGIQSHIHKN